MRSSFDHFITFILHEQSSLNPIDGTDGDDDLTGTVGNDLMSGFGGHDILRADKGNDVILGGDDFDVLIGGKGKDVIHGDAGDDIIDAGRNRDVLVGGAGSDLLNGNFGADKFVFGAADGTMTDTILDYSLSQGDAIVLDNGIADVASDAIVDGEWQLTLTDGHIIQIDSISDTDGNGHITDNISILDGGA